MEQNDQEKFAVVDEETPEEVILETPEEVSTPEVQEEVVEETLEQKMYREAMEELFNRGVEKAEKSAKALAGKPRKQRHLILSLDKSQQSAGGKSKIGITRKDKSKSKDARKAEKNSRKINQKISNKKSRPTGSKQRK